MGELVPIVNRGCLVVKPNMPYVEWINTLPTQNETLEFDELDADYATYLIPEVDDEEDVSKAVEAQFEKIFETELETWTTDKSKWPEITWTRFCEWFEVDCSSLILDLCEDPLEYEK